MALYDSSNPSWYVYIYIYIKIWVLLFKRAWSSFLNKGQGECGFDHSLVLDIVPSWGVASTMCFSAPASFAFGPAAYTVRSPSETAGDHIRREGTEKSGQNKNCNKKTCLIPSCRRIPLTSMVAPENLGGCGCLRVYMNRGLYKFCCCLCRAFNCCWLYTDQALETRETRVKGTEWYRYCILARYSK